MHVHVHDIVLRLIIIPLAHVHNYFSLLSYQARNLIQQGKSRGQVTIVVATRGHVPSLSGSGMGVGEWGGGEKGGTGSAGGPVTSTMTAVDSRNKIKDIPDGVVLRKKKKSKHFIFK